MAARSATVRSARPRAARAIGSLDPAQHAPRAGRRRRGPRATSPRTVPARSASAALAWVAPMSTPTTTRALGLSASSDGGRPPVETPPPNGATRPSRISRSIAGGDRRAGQPARVGQLGPRPGPPVPQQLEDVAGPHGRKSSTARLLHVQQTTFADSRQKRVTRATVTRVPTITDPGTTRSRTPSCARGLTKSFVGNTVLDDVDLEPAGRPGPRPRRRERRRQVHADEDPRRRLHRPTPARSSSAATRCRSATRSRRSRPACPRSSRSSTCCPSARSPRTSTSAASRAAAASSTPRRMQPRHRGAARPASASTGLAPGQRVRSLSRRRAADRRDRQGGQLRRPGHPDGRADRRARRPRGRAALRDHRAASPSAASRSSTSPTGSRRSSTSATPSPCSRTASRSPPGRPPSSTTPSSCG